MEVALAMHVACATIDVRAVQTSIADAIKHPADLYFLIATSSNDEGRPLVGGGRSTVGRQSLTAPNDSWLPPAV
jgi:hypothetical protein